MTLSVRLYWFAVQLAAIAAGIYGGWRLFHWWS